MRKIYNLLLIFSILSISFGASAQQLAENASNHMATYTVPLKGDEVLRGVVKERIDMRYPNQVIGHTYYDLQTNNTLPKRLATDGKGGIAASWTISLLENDDAFPDRGGAYNFFDGSEWGDDPEGRVEAERCGWPSIHFDGDGNTIMVSHENGAQQIAVSRKKAGEDTWDYNLIPTKANGVLWPRSAIGGSDNKTIHAIGITLPVANFNGSVYEGVDAHILYYRSQDGGDTWDITDGIIPGLDKDSYAAMELDAYSIEARGNTVAIAVYGEWGDLVLFKSTDNGDNWTKTVIMDFPLENYITGTPYDTNDIGGMDPKSWGGIIDDADLTETQRRSIYTTDGSGTLAIDSKGICHMAIGEMIVSYDDVSAGGVFYPGLNGIIYWNENMASEDDMITNGFALDLDEDVVVDLNFVARYTGGLATYPALVIDDNDQLFMAYSAVVETLLDEGDEGEYYRHIYMTTSKDDGGSWTDPFDVINFDFYKGTDDEDLENETECVFPSLAVDDNGLYLLFQLDFEPGMHVPATDPRDDIEDQEMSFLRFGKDDFTLVERIVSPSTFDMSITPNPAHDVTLISFDLTNASIARLEVYDMNGQILMTEHLGNLNSGTHQHKLNVNLTAGIYIVKLVVNKAASSMKLVIE